ncbi:MAG TPA: hypothetical protein VHV82_14895 [Sporichthyaceae bacterium]|jgi:hypothetical protein|nr:hypothetical protein [Sporichthyaceae bacterium]
MTLSITGTVVMVVIIAGAVVAMILVLASANRRNASAHQEPNREERPDLRYPGLNPDAARRHADLVGDDATASVEPGGHVIRPFD